MQHIGLIVGLRWVSKAYFIEGRPRKRWPTNSNEDGTSPDGLRSVAATDDDI